MPINEHEVSSLSDEVMRIEQRNFVSDKETEALLANNLSLQQHADLDLAFIIQEKQQGLDPPTAEEFATKSDEVRLICAQWDSLVYTDGLLYRLFEDVRKNTVILEVIVPRQLRMMFVRQCHTGMTGGHQGVKKMEQQVARGAYFP
jgi:hypothetical protein